MIFKKFLNSHCGVYVFHQRDKKLFKRFEIVGGGGGGNRSRAGLLEMKRNLIIRRFFFFNIEVTICIIPNKS